MLGVRKFFGKRWGPALAAVSLLGVVTGGAQAGALYFDFNANVNPPDASVFLFGDAGQQVTVSNLAGFNQVVNLNSDGFYNMAISSTYQQSGTGIRNTGFRVVSADPVAGYFVNRASATTDMTYLFDEDGLGNEYVVSSYGGGYGEGSQVAIHAIEDGTVVTFTPTGGAAIVVNLNAGETYKYAGGSTDLTGSTVSSNNNVAVFGGNNCTNIGGVSACDTLVEQMISTDNLSTSYQVTASGGAEVSSTQKDIVRVIGTVDATSVTVNGVAVGTVNKGEVYEFDLAQGTGASVEASAAVMVAQYLTGIGSGSPNVTDPAMALVPGEDAWLSEYRLATPSGSQVFAVNYASIVIELGDLASLMLDGVGVNAGLFSAIPGTSFVRGIVDLPVGLFDLVADNSFLVMLGGGDSWDSYFTFGGATFAPGISPPECGDPGQPPCQEPSVPEPGPLALLGFGLAALSVTRVRWRNRT